MNTLDVVLLIAVLLSGAACGLLLIERRRLTVANAGVVQDARLLRDAKMAGDVQLSRQSVELDTARARFHEVSEANLTLTARLDDLRSEAESARLKESEAQLRLDHVEQNQDAMRDAFRLASSEAVRAALDDLGKRHEDLAKRAEADRQQHTESSRERLAAQLQPLAETLSRFEKKITAIDQDRNVQQGELRQQIAQVLKASSDTQAEARKLSGALRRGAGLQGRWGEQTLRNVLEQAGLQNRFDFAEQVSTQQEGTRRRPDVTVRMPGGGVLVVDAKCSLTAFMEAQDAIDDASRLAALSRHAVSLRTHVQGLAAKEYWTQFDKAGSPDFVTMFVPGETFLHAALEHAPNLFVEAMEKGVVIVTPMTLFALCKIVAQGWRAEEQARHSEDIAKLGKELYARLSTMGKHVGQLGKNLEAAVGKYNDFVGSLETKVLTQARRFEELSADHQGRDLIELASIDLKPRALTKLAVIKSEAEAVLADAQSDVA